MEPINWLSMVIATLTPLVVGFIYYNKNVFGKAWLISLGKTEEDLKQGNKALIFGLSIVLSFLLAFFLLNFNNSPGQEGEFDTFRHGAWHGIFISVVVGIPIMVINGLFELKKAKNLLINIGYWVLTLALMGGVIDAMNHWPN
ncbi:MAG: DUF1761 domain-containing protein [Flavobacteriaceae bacterium]|nr:DUF1761 domain-containing protein [Bacteroidia bacterium]NNK69412.1 DUF1761 domain-containing protein [Flavobacteriaceae bacterium]